MKSPKFIRIHPLGAVNVWTIFLGHPSNCCLDISVWTKLVKKPRIQTTCKPLTSFHRYLHLLPSFSWIESPHGDSSISVFPTKHCSITSSSFIPGLRAGLSNRICLTVNYSLIHISATPSQPRSTLMSLWERIMSFQQSLDCVFSGRGRTACGGGVSAESQ